MRPRWRARLAAIAIVALLSNALLPAALVFGLGGSSADHDTFSRLGFCSAVPGRGVPGKAKPTLLVHHCALCTMASDALPPAWEAAAAVTPIVVGEAFLLRTTTALSAPFRNYRTRPRAPPATA